MPRSGARARRRGRPPCARRACARYVRAQRRGPDVKHHSTGLGHVRLPRPSRRGVRRGGAHAARKPQTRARFISNDTDVRVFEKGSVGTADFFPNSTPARALRRHSSESLHHQQAVAGTKKKRAFSASRPDDRSSRNPSSSQTYPIARRRRRSLARPSLDRPHAFALAREPFSDPTLPAKPAGFAFSSREEKARFAAPLERRRPLPPRVARAQLCRLPPPRIARVVLVSSYRALRRDASDAREQTTCVSRRRRARRRPLVRRSLAEAGERGGVVDLGVGKVGRDTVAPDALYDGVVPMASLRCFDSLMH